LMDEIKRRVRAERMKKVKDRMSKVKHKIAVISGKGGVGKSVVTVNLAMAFAVRGYTDKVGILDTDITGPSVPKIIGLQGEKVVSTPEREIVPAVGPLGIKVVSMALMLETEETPVIWRGPLKARAITQLLSDVIWGELDFLFIDLPPGTGDEPLSIMQLIPDLDGVVIVTIPSEVSQIVVKKAVTFARHLKAPIIGVIENMSGFICPNCGKEIDIFKRGGGQKIAEDMNIPFLGRIPIDPEICDYSDKGLPFVTENKNSPATKAFMEIVKKIEEFLNQENGKHIE